MGEYVGDRIHRAWRLTSHGRERGVLDSSLRGLQGTTRTALGIEAWVGWQVLSAVPEACKLWVETVVPCLGAEPWPALSQRPDVSGRCGRMPVGALPPRRDL